MRLLSTLFLVGALAFGQAARATPAPFKAVATSAKTMRKKPKMRFKPPTKMLRPLYTYKKKNHGRPLN